MKVFDINKNSLETRLIPSLPQQYLPVEENLCLNQPDEFAQENICLPDSETVFQRPNIKTQEPVENDNFFPDLFCAQNDGFAGQISDAKSSVVVMARHIHTENHHIPVGKVTVAEIQKRYEDTDFVGIEDHGRFFAFPKCIQKTVGPAVIPGAESYVQIDLFKPDSQVNVKHHVGILGVDADEEKLFNIKAGQKPSELKENVHNADGVIIFNHPEYPYIDKAGSSEKALEYTIAQSEAAAIDAVEVVNDVGFTGSEPLNVLNWVEKNFYERGLFPAIVAGQDDHGPTEIAKHPTYTMALTGNKTEHGLIDAVRNSKTYISKSIDTKIDLNIDNLSGLGEKPSLQNGSIHTFNFEIDKIPVNSKVEVVYNGKIIENYHVNAESLKAALKFTASPGKDNKNGYLYLRSIDTEGKLNFLSSALVFSVE